MARLVIKNGYIQGGKGGGHLSHLVKYVATRDGVENISNGRELWSSTAKQNGLVAQILREFPDTKESLEYEDYTENPTRENASEFIRISLEQHMEQLGDSEKYVDYIANRPRVERLSTHGLFHVGDTPLVLEQVIREVATHQGNVWTPIISLRREDAITFSFENAQAWKSLLASKAMEIADSLKIHPDHFKWYAAFHNESHHPHVHMICYSTNSAEGYLTKAGIQKMKSALATEVFKQELLPLYAEKTQHRNSIKEEAHLLLQELLVKMKSGTLQNEKIEELIGYLANELQNTTGKKQYGYLKPKLKNVVDEIIKELSKEESVAEAYRLWQVAKGKIETIYTEQGTALIPLHKCVEFKSVRNMVIKEAVQIAEGGFFFDDSEVENGRGSKSVEESAEKSTEEFTFDETPSIEEIIPIDSFEDAISPSMEIEDRQQAEIGDGQQAEISTENIILAEEKRNCSHDDHKHHKTLSWWTEDYKLAKQFLYGDEAEGIVQDFTEAKGLLLFEAHKNNPLAMYDLGRMYADGLLTELEESSANQWYEKAFAIFQTAESKNPWKYTQYRIGKMYAAGIGTEQDYEQAAQWLTLSAMEQYKFAQYSLGSLYYRGHGVEQSYQTAFDLYRHAANQNVPYASFELGQMYRDGIGCTKDSTASTKQFQKAFLGFTELEQQSKDDKLQYRLGWMLLNGVGTQKEVEKARFYFEKAATVGNPFACYQLAKLILLDDEVTAPEIEKALNYMKQAVEADNPHAQYFLGKLYEIGQHVPQNMAETVRLYQLSAVQEHDHAAYRLGKIYLSGVDVLKDVKEAIYWLNFSAEKGNQFAAYKLGSLYYKGELVPQDIPKAITFLNKAAEQENEYAQYTLGKIYLSGEGIPKEIEKAIYYLTASATQENQFAQYALGKLYLMGKDIPKDKELAIKWFTLSAEQGNIYAQYFLEHMDNFKEPSVMLAATKLLHHMSNIIGDTVPIRVSPNMQIDRKRLYKLREKKQAQGHARNDHEQSMTL